ncbi:MAG: hypothetical protein IJU37_12500 [Desulfovibrio sp.]|nr:hypothetical protein [Desulfovibrio sp.]
MAHQIFSGLQDVCNPFFLFHFTVFRTQHDGEDAARQAPQMDAGKTDWMPVVEQTECFVLAMC